jgi:parvulin-like peptidyl-prolyl isomerase
MSKKINDSKVNVKDETSKKVSVKKSEKVSTKSSKKVVGSKVSERKKINHTKKKSKVSNKYVSVIVGIFIGLLFVFLVLFFTNSTEKSSGVVATYDGIELSESEFNQSIDISLFLQGSPSEYKDSIPKGQLLNQTILLNVLFDRAKTDGHLAKREDVISFIENSLVESGTSVENFKVELVNQTFSYEDLINFFIKQNTINAYVEASVSDNLVVSDEEVLEYYNIQKESYVGDLEIKASHILVETEDEANNVISMLDSGSDFSDLAKSESTGPSGPNGGDLGFFGKGAMVFEFEAAAFGLKNIGDYTTEPVKTQFGYHIIKLVDKKNAEVPEFSLIKTNIEEALKSQKKNVVVGEFIEEVMSSIEINYLN